jgi:signal peptidase II
MMTEKASYVWRWGVAAAAVALIADQASKWLIVNVVMNPPQLMPITPFFNLTLGLNRGVSFGMLSEGLGDTPWVLIIISLIIVAAMVVWLTRTRALAEALGLGAIIGGALGNIVDRLRLGGVIDFLDFHVAGWHWPAFNMADTAITIGVALLLLSTLVERRGAPQQA